MTTTRLILALAFLVSLSGCNLVSVPSPNHPDCFWAKQPPPNDAAICQSVARTLNRLVRAELADNRGMIRELVRNPQIAKQIIAHGVFIRAHHIEQYHVVPSLTLDDQGRGVIGAGIYLRGKTAQGGRLKQEATLYLLVQHGIAVVIDHEPGQTW